MIGEAQKVIIIMALNIRKGRGEDPEEVLKGYINLKVTEKAEILNKVNK